MAVDHGHRRVDPSSRLYAATEFLFTRLAQFPITSKAPTNAENSQTLATLPPPPPLESLLRLLTPREIAFCLSDARRTVRLRAHLAWRASGGFGTTGSDFPGIPSSTGDLKDGIFALNGGILRALAQSHLAEEGLASLVPRFLNQLTAPSESVSSASRRIASILNRKAGETEVEEVPEEKEEAIDDQSVMIIDDGEDDRDAGVS